MVNYVITGRNEVVAKVMILHLSVSHSVHRGCVCLLLVGRGGVCSWSLGIVCLLLVPGGLGKHPLGRHPPLGRHSLGRHPPGRHPLPTRDTGNERPVRILLECILVFEIIFQIKVFYWHPILLKFNGNYWWAVNI